MITANMPGIVRTCLNHVCGNKSMYRWCGFYYEWHVWWALYGELRFFWLNLFILCLPTEGCQHWSGSPWGRGDKTWRGILGWSFMDIHTQTSTHTKHTHTHTKRAASPPPKKKNDQWCHVCFCVFWQVLLGIKWMYPVNCALTSCPGISPGAVLGKGEKGEKTMIGIRITWALRNEFAVAWRLLCGLAWMTTMAWWMMMDDIEVYLYYWNTCQKIITSRAGVFQ